MTSTQKGPPPVASYGEITDISPGETLVIPVDPVPGTCSVVTLRTPRRSRRRGPCRGGRTRVRLPYNSVGEDLRPLVLGPAPFDEPRVDFHYPVFGNSLALIDSTLHLAIILEAAERGGIPRLAHVPWSQRPRAKRLPKHDLSVRGPQERCVHALGYHSRGNGVNELRTLARSRLGERARLLET